MNNFNLQCHPVIVEGWQITSVIPSGVEVWHLITLYLIVTFRLRSMWREFLLFFITHTSINSLLQLESLSSCACRRMTDCFRHTERSRGMTLNHFLSYSHISTSLYVKWVFTFLYYTHFNKLTVTTWIVVILWLSKDENDNFILRKYQNNWIFFTEFL